LSQINKYSSLLVEPTESVILAIKYAIDLKGGLEVFLEEIPISKKSVEMWLNKIEPVPLKIIVKVCNINRIEGGENLPIEVRYFDLCIKGAKIVMGENLLNIFVEKADQKRKSYSESYNIAIRYWMDKIKKVEEESSFSPQEALRFLSGATSIGLFVIVILILSEMNNWPRNIVIPVLVIIVLIFPFLEIYLIDLRRKESRQHQESTNTI